MKRGTGNSQRGERRGSFRWSAAPFVAFATAAGVFSGVASAAVGVRVAAPGRELFRGGGSSGALVTAAVATPDDGVLVLGDTGKTWFYVTKLTADGALDSAFGEGGVARVTVGLSGFSPRTVTRQTDGKLVIGATFETPLRSAVVRLNADGSLDQSFGHGGVALPPLLGLVDLALGPGDAIVLSGSTSTGSTGTNATRWAVARLTQQGAPDESFGQAGIATLPGPATTGVKVAALANGTIVAIGQYIVPVPGGPTIVYLTRLLASGAIDPGFNDGVPITAPPSAFYDLEANPDGSVILGQGSQLVRYTPAGLPDATFGPGGIAPLKAVEGELQLLSAPDDGAIAVGGPQDGLVRSTRLRRPAARILRSAQGPVSSCASASAAAARLGRRAGRGHCQDSPRTPSPAPLSCAAPTARTSSRATRSSTQPPAARPGT
jgi:uncharacterized delta-60 repeat protein